jgi:hypothetical protein
MSNSVGGAIAEGIQGGWQMGLQSDAAQEHKREFNAEQASREEAQRRLAKQEDDRYGRMQDAARVQAAQAHLDAVQKQVDGYAGKGPVPDWLFQQKVDAQIQLEDMQKQVATTGRLSSQPVAAPMQPTAPAPAPQPAVRPAVPAPAPQAMGLATALPTGSQPPAAPPTAGLQGALATPQPGPQAPGAPTQPGLGPQNGPAGVAPPMGDSGSPIVGAAPDAGSAPLPGAAPQAAAVSSPTSSAITPSQQLVTGVDQQSQDLASRLQTGQIGLKDVKPVDYALMVASATGHAPDQLDQVRQHIADWQTGMTTSNNGLMLQGLNGIFGPRIQQGVGSPSPYGGTITGKSIIGLDPAMSADGSIHADKVIPRLQVTTDVMGPTGQPLSYHAPMTQNRSSDPNDPVTAIPVADAANHIGAMGALVEAASHPDAQALLAQGAKDPRVQQYLDAARLAAQPTNPALVAENQIQNIMKATGLSHDDAVERMYQTKMLVRPPPTKGVVGQTMDAAQQLVDDGTAPDIPSALRVLQAGGVTKQPTKYSRGGGVGAGGTGAPSSNGGQAVGTINPITGSRVLPVPDKNGLVLGYTPSALDRLAYDYIVRGQGAFQNMGRGDKADPVKKAVSNRADELMTAAGISPQDYVEGKDEYKTNARSLALQVLRGDAIDSSMSKIANDFGTINATISGGNADIAPFLSKPLNEIRSGLGSPELASYKLAVKQVATEYERLLTGGQLSTAQLHDGARKDAENILNENMTVAQINGLIPVMQREMNNAQQAAHGQINTIRGRMKVGGSSAGPAAAAGNVAPPTGVPGVPTQGGAPAPAAAAPGKPLVYDPSTGTFH